MISIAHPLALLVGIPLIALTLYVWRNAYANMSPTRMRVALVLRSIILLALCLSLAGTSIRVPQSREAVALVADLSASDAGQRSAMQTFINDVASKRPSNGVMGVVTVGKEPLVEQPVSGLSGFDTFQTSVDPRYSNLEGGLDLANALLPDGYRHRIVLISDGQQNVGDALASSRLLRSGGARVDVVAAHARGGPEVLVDHIDMPAQLRARESFQLTVTVRSTVATTTGITFVRDHTAIGTKEEKLQPGINRFVFDQGPLPPGFHTYDIRITPAVDTQPENNEGSAFVSVQSGPRVLVIAQDQGEAANVVTSLKSTGISVDLQSPAAVTPDLSYLQRYSGVVIVDTDAASLGASLMTQLVPYVRDLGRGLLVIGGQSAYSMGGYGGTPLEQVLPVRMDLPKKRSMPTTAVALIIESLEEDTQINISKEAGKGVVNLLTPQDQVAVNDAPFDSSSGWVVPMQHVTNKSRIDAAIDRMAPGDPDSYTPSLQAAYTALKHTNARIKHIILLGDGDAEDFGYQQLVENFRAHGVTVSTIGTNGVGRNDVLTMENIAQWGGGRYYSAENPSKIPQIFLREARTIARLGIVQGKFFPQELSSNPMLRDVSRVAPLYGYIATTPKPAGEIVLASNKLDPVLASWQLGLGRAVAWTSDAAGLWTKDWLRAPGANRFWANLVSWTFPATGTGKLAISASTSQGQGRISVGTLPSLGADPVVTAHVLDPQLHTTTVQLQPSAPGQFAGTFPEGAQGSYFVTLQARGAGHAEAGQIGMAASYSPEYTTTGINTAFLHSIASAGGGGVIAQAQDAWLGNLPSVLATYDLTFWLSLLAVLLLPIDIGVRRLRVGRRELDTILAALPRRSTTQAEGERDILPLGALRARRAQRVPASPPSIVRQGFHTGPAITSRIAPGRVSPPSSAAASPQHPNDPSESPPTASDDETTASKLLARRRKDR